MVHLPLELIGHILSKLDVAPLLIEENLCTVSGEEAASREKVASGEKAALDACTLVCCTWKPMATSLLFRHVRYSFSYDLTWLDRTVEMDPDCAVPGMRWNCSSWWGGHFHPHKTLDQFHSFVSQNP